jgi:translation initiation factor RLI1
MEFLSFENKQYDNLAKEILSEISFPFPSLKTTTDECNYNFFPFNPKVGTLNVVYGRKDIGKSYFLDLISGSSQPTMNIDKNNLYLKYEIIYKQQNIQPKFNGSVSDLCKIKLNGNINEDIYREVSNLITLKKFSNKNVQDLSIEEIEKLSFLFSVLEDKSIYIFDFNVRTIQLSVRDSMLEYLYNFVKKFNKIAIIVEDNIDIIRKYTNNIYFIEEIEDLNDENLDENLTSVIGKEYNLDNFLLRAQNTRI